MIAPAAEQALVPSAACFHIGDGDQRLRAHLSSVSSQRLTRTILDAFLTHVLGSGTSLQCEKRCQY
jgi:hypothetical protein